MMRHTGDYLLGTMFLAAALILQLSQADVRSATKLISNHELAGAAVNSSPAKNTSWTRLSRVCKTPSPSVNAVLSNLPRGTRIVVGSLDMSGSRHQIWLSSRNDGSPDNNSLAVTRFTRESIRRLQGPETMHSLSSRARSGRDPQLVQTAAYELPAGDAKLLQSTSNAVDRRTTDTFSTQDEILNSHEISLPSTATMEQLPRMFIMPHFSETGTIHKPGDCRAIGESQRIRVYVDQGLPQSSSAHQMHVWAELLITAVEFKALPIAETWIGPICDVDRNEKLSIVITDLDQRGQKSVDRSPILGCIRESDFCPESDFCGDIVYIDKSIFELPSAEVNGVLTHEIAHAAICSLSHGAGFYQHGNLQQKSPFSATSANMPIPPWLNEAVAHYLELQSSHEGNASSHAAHEFFTENFQRRIDAFLAGPGGSPIVASEFFLNMEERRSGSRGAATLFLASLVSTPRDLQALLWSDDSMQVRIEDLAQHPFSDVFRSWTLAIASITNDADCLSVEKIEPNFESKHYSLLGTAFHCFECSDDIKTLVLTSDELAQLQISIIEPAVRDAPIAQLKPWSQNSGHSHASF